jgi:hypothetical protein
VQDQHDVGSDALRWGDHGELAFFQMEFMNLTSPFGRFAADDAVGVVLALDQAMVDLKEGVEVEALLEGGVGLGEDGVQAPGGMFLGFGIGHRFFFRR